MKKNADEDILKIIILLLFLALLPVLFPNQIFPKSGLELIIIARILLVASIIVGVLYIVYKIRKRRKFYASKIKLEELRALTPNQFEEYITDLFRRLGYITQKIGGRNDGGIDVIATKNGVKHYIQCKKYINRKVSIGDVRNFYGAMADKLNNAKGFFITTNIFTLEAEKFAEGKPLELIDGNKLMDYVKLVRGVTAPEIKSVVCPSCSGKLIERNGKFGKFMGCSNYPKCKYTEQI